MTAPVKLLLIFINEADRWQGMPLSDAIVLRLLRLNIAGATVHVGTVRFGRHMRLHHKGLFGISDDRPVTISVVENEARLRAALPEIRAMVREGVLLLLDAELIADSECELEAT